MPPSSNKTTRILVTGVGFRSTTSPSAQHENIFSSATIKPNIGAGIARRLAGDGFPIIITSTTYSKLSSIRTSLIAQYPDAEISCYALDLLDSRAVVNFVNSLPKDRGIDLVHSAGLGAGNYQLPDDNPYQEAPRTPTDLPPLEFDAVVSTLLNLVQALLPVWRAQTNARIVVVGSMSGIRAVPLGFSHSAAKGGLHQAVRSLTLELNPERIRVSEILPGIVDTGLYDPLSVREAVQRMGDCFGYDYPNAELPMMSVNAVADATHLCLTSDAHILEIAMVADGQFPHTSS